MSVVLTILASILVFGAIILIHELGHFCAAKLSGIKVLEFAMGMGPKLFGFKKGDTTYCLRLFPIGGSVKMEGEDEDETDAESTEEEIKPSAPAVAYTTEVSTSAEAAVSTPPVMHVAAADGVTVLATDVDAEIDKNKRKKKEPRETKPFYAAPVGNRILVIVAGAIMNLVLGFSVLFGLTVASPAIATRTISKFSEDAKTQVSGLQINDTILAINGRNMYVADDIIYELIRVKDAKADILVRRDGEKVLLEDVQFDTEVYEDGTSGIKLDFKVYAAEKTFGAVLKESALWTVSIARQIFLSLVDLITGNVPINQLSGPVGIVTIISEATSIGWSSVLMILAFISINLGVFNLLPLPALDGGRLVFLLFEAVTRKKFPAKYEAIVHFVGLMLLFALMIFVTFNDVSKLFVK